MLRQRFHRRAARITLLTLGLCALNFHARGQGFVPTYPVPLNENASTDSHVDSDPALATNGTGTWIAAWTLDRFQTGALDVVGSRSTDNGVTWAQFSLAPSDVTNDANPHLVAGGNGTWVVVWESEFLSGDYDIAFSRSTDNGVTWSAPALLNSNASVNFLTNRNPRVATDRVGNWVVVWEAETLQGDDIAVSRSTDNGATWSAIVSGYPNATTVRSHNVDPDIATDAEGNWLMVWSGSNDDVPPLSMDWDIFVARSINNGASWTAPMPVNTDAAVDNVDHDYVPAIATDQAGMWKVVWSSNVLNYNSVEVSQSTDNGGSWSAPYVIDWNFGAGVDVTDYPAIATDQAGTWFVTWHDRLGNELGQDIDLVAARFASGIWFVNRLNTDASNDVGSDEYPCLATDGIGNWMALWVCSGSPENYEPDIHLTRWVWAILGIDVYVNFNAERNGDGTPLKPFDNLSDAKAIVNDGGTIRIVQGASNETFVGVDALGKGNRPLVLRKNSAGGVPVRIGAP